MSPRVAKCGTRAGHARHKRHGERPCLACYDAVAAYQRARRAALKAKEQKP